MAQALERLLDRWEPRLTRPPKRWQEKTPPRWALWLSPDLALMPAQPYSWRLLLRETLTPVALWAVLVILINVAAVALACHTFPWFWRQVILHHGPAHTQFIGFLAKQGVYLLPWYILIMALMGVTLRLPRFLCWNRRAARLRRGPAPAPAAPTPPDPTVWPPAPRGPG